MVATTLLLLLAGPAWTAPGPSIPVWVEVDDRDTVERAQAAGLGFLESSRVDDAGRRWLLFEVPQHGTDALELAGLRWSAAAPPAYAAAAGYLGPDEMVSALDALAERAPSLAQRIDLGESVEGRPLVGLRLSATDTPAVRWRVLAAHHGDELPSGELALVVAQDLLDRYGDDPDVTALLDRDAVWVVPHVNPDGVAEVTRANARGVDLNRNYDFQWSAAESRSGDAPFSEPEARAVQALSGHVAFGAGLSLHAGATNLGWVWNYSYTGPPDEPLVAAMADRYADACAQRGFWVTNGADWYPTRGDTNDWSYGRHGTLDFTLEVSTDKQPDADSLPGILDDHLGAVRAWLLWPDSVAGLVVDAETGRPLPATVQLDGAQPLLAGLDGRFGRPVDGPGSLSATITAPGFAAADVTLRPGAPATVALDNRALIAATPEPAILSRGGDGCFSLADARPARAWLSRPGHAPVDLAAADCGWQAPLTTMAAGAWDLHLDDSVAPRSIFVGAHSDAVVITAAAVEGAAVEVSGAGFGAGTRAWALAGLQRAPLALSVHTEGPRALTLDAAALTDLPDPVDLLVVSDGAWLAVRDLRGDAEVDDEAPADGGDGTAEGGYGSDTGRAAAPPPASTGCHALPRPPLAGLAALSLLAVARRRETR